MQEKMEIHTGQIQKRTAPGRRGIWAIWYKVENAIRAGIFKTIHYTQAVRVKNSDRSPHVLTINNIHRNSSINEDQSGSIPWSFSESGPIVDAQTQYIADSIESM